MAKKKGLSRGLEHLFEQNFDINDDNQIIMIDLDDLIVNPYQPRTVFDEEALLELSKSIEVQGVFQPILVRRAAIGYEIISGERRFRASKLAGKTEIPAIVYTYTDEQMMEVALIENVQREDLNVVEEAKSYQMMMKKLSFTQKEIAEKVGKSRSHIANMVRLLNLDEEILDMIQDDKLTMGHVKTLITVEDKNKQKDIATRIVNEKLNVRESEQLIKDKKNPSQKAIKRKSETQSNEYKRLEEILRDKLDSKIVIKGKEKGSITIEFNSPDDLERILENMKIL